MSLTSRLKEQRLIGSDDGDSDSADSDGNPDAYFSTPEREQQGGRAMERAQRKCPVCAQSLKGLKANHAIRSQFGLEYEGVRIELCSWECFCRFFQEAEQYYLNYKQETGGVVPRLESMLKALAQN